MKHPLLLLILPLAIVLSCSSKDENLGFLGREHGIEQFNDQLGFKGFTSSKDPLISQFPELTTTDSTSEVFWKVVQKGEPYVDLLIYNLTDTTPTKIYSKCLEDYLNVGDVCLIALETIAEFPTAATYGFQTCIPSECWPFDAISHQPKYKEKIHHDVLYFWENNKFTLQPLDDYEDQPFKKKLGITHKLKLHPTAKTKSDPMPF